MAYREFETSVHSELYNKYRATPPVAVIQRIIDFLKEKYTGPLDLAVDLGCGTGQCSFLLQPYFANVLAFDISPTQIQEAKKLEQKPKNVTFKVSPAEKIEVSDGSVQLITASTSAHYFDLEKVYAEGRRVLCPGGVMAFLCVNGKEFLVVEMGENERKNQGFIEIIEYVYNFLEPFFSSPVKSFYKDKTYANIKIPFQDFTREEGFWKKEVGKLTTIIGIIKTFSGFQNYCKALGNEEGNRFIRNVQNRFLECAGISESESESDIFTLSSNYVLVMARL